MSNKKGFISISIIYSFFIIFMLFLVLIMSTYVNNRFKFNVYKNDIKKKLIDNPEVITLSDQVISLVGQDYNSSQDGSKYRVANQNGIRYEGKDPDNYVIFNNEIWRIIGTFEGADIGLESGVDYTKIVRANDIGTYKWNSTANNSWENSTLHHNLNGPYYNSLTNKNMIVESWWHVGNVSDYNLYTDEMYNTERSSGTVIRANIGLMYASDYGYSAYSATCDNISTDTLFWYERHCKNASWLFNYNTTEWFITPYYYSAALIRRNGGWVSNDSTGSSLYVRPTLYLQSDVYITGGDGSASKPYTLDI